jgi:hypothetical protein
MCGCCSNSLFKVAIGVGNFDGVYMCVGYMKFFANQQFPITHPQRTKV